VAKPRAQWTHKWIPPERALAVFTRDDFRCVYCGGEDPDREAMDRRDAGVRAWHAQTSPRALHIDHIVPRVLGVTSATNDAGNLATACRTCNQAKGTMAVDSFLATCMTTKQAAAARKRIKRIVDGARWCEIHYGSVVTRRVATSSKTIFVRPLYETDAGVRRLKNGSSVRPRVVVGSYSVDALGRVIVLRRAATRGLGDRS